MYKSELAVRMDFTPTHTIIVLKPASTLYMNLSFELVLNINEDMLTTIVLISRRRCVLMNYSAGVRYNKCGGATCV